MFQVIRTFHSVFCGDIFWSQGTSHLSHNFLSPHPRWNTRPQAVSAWVACPQAASITNPSGHRSSTHRLAAFCTDCSCSRSLCLQQSPCEAPDCHSHTPFPTPLSPGTKDRESVHSLPYHIPRPMGDLPLFLIKLASISLWLNSQPNKKQNETEKSTTLYISPVMSPLYWIYRWKLFSQLFQRLQLLPSRRCQKLFWPDYRICPLLPGTPQKARPHKAFTLAQDKTIKIQILNVHPTCYPTMLLFGRRGFPHQQGHTY